MIPPPARDAAGWRLQSVDGLLLLRCVALDGIPGLAHAFSTRRCDGADDFDLGSADDRSAQVMERRSRFLAAAGIDGEAAVLQQVHGRHVIDNDIPLDPAPRADGATWTGGRQAPAVRSADCVPILIADRGGRAAAAVHAGWRGTAAEIAGVAVAFLVSQGIAAGALVAALGPAIGACCYEVGDDVARALGDERAQAEPLSGSSREAAGPFFVDLRGVNRAQLIRAGLAEDAIHVSPWCTRCRDDLFFSYRRDRQVAGRMMATVGRSRHLGERGR